MTLNNAVEAVMVYASYSDEDIDIMSKVLETYTKGVPSEAYKSIRLENASKEIEKLKKLEVDSRSFKVTIKDAKVEYTCIKYQVRSEKGHRLAVCSKQCVHPFTVRVFTDTATFNRFRANNKINVCEEFSFHELKIIRYESAESKVVRYAVYAPLDTVFRRTDFKSSVMALGRGSATSLFT